MQAAVNNAYMMQIQLAKRLGLLQKEPLRTLALFYLNGKLASPTQRKLLQRELRKVERYHERHPDRVLFPAPTTTKGDILLGTSQGTPVSLPASAFTHHTLITASTGSGKTYLIIAVLRGFLRWTARKNNACAIWVFEYAKGELLNLIPLFESFKLPAFVLRRDNLYLNLLQIPKSVNAADWIALLVDYFRFCFALGDSSMRSLRRILLRLYADQANPTLAQLIDAIRADIELAENVRDALLNRFEGLIHAVPHLGDCQDGYPIDQLEQRNLIIDLHGMDNESTLLITAWLRYAVYARRIASKAFSTEPTLLLIDDEASRVYGTDFIDASFLAQLISTQRALGVAQVLSTQDLRISHQVLANTGTRIMGVLNNTRDINACANVLGLDLVQRRWAATHLRTGLFLCKTAVGTHRTAFLLETPHLKPLPVATETVIDEHALALQRLLPPRASTATTSMLEQTDASNDASSLLGSAADPSRLTFKLTQHYDACGLPRRRAVKAKDQLVDRGLVVEHEIATGNPGRQPKVLEVTPKGFAALGLPLPPWAGRSGAFLRHLVLETFMKVSEHEGAAVEPDVGQEGRSVDLLIARNGVRTAVLSACDPPDAVAPGIAAALHAAAEVLVVCFDLPTRRVLEQRYVHQPEVSFHWFPLAPEGSPSIPFKFAP